jgi:GT2 family glycosyltransferase
VNEIRASLIVLNWEGEDVIGPCLDSLAAAACPEDEIIVVDNASTDGSLELLRARSDIRLVALTENTYIFGLNDGLEVARGRYVAFLNNDMIVEPSFVERCLARFGDGEDVFAVCPRVLETTGLDQGSRTSALWRRGLIFYMALPHVPEATDCFFAVGGQSFFRRSMLDELGSIDPLLKPMYHEDIELSYRAWKRGWRIRYEPDAVAHHEGSHSSKRVFSRTQLRSFVRQNEYLTVWKNITDRRLLVEHIALIPLRLVTAVLKRDWATLVGFGRAASRLRAVARARRHVRTHARLRDRDVLARVSRIV